MAAVMNASPNAVLASDREIHAKRQQLASALSHFLPSAAVLTAKEDLRPYECDGLSAYRQLPMLAALPSTTAEVESIMRVANAQDAKVRCAGIGHRLVGWGHPTRRRHSAVTRQV